MAIQISHGFIFRDFSSYGEFKHFHETAEDPHHYEIIQGKQCLYFDFDGTLDIEGLVKSIRKRLEPHPIIVNIYSSSDKFKSSYHVIVKGVYFRDHKACGQVAKEIANNFSSFDHSVYSAKRNLRLLGSRKIDSSRVKVFAGIGYKSEDFSDRHEADPLFMSLASCVGDGKLIEIEQPVIIPVSEPIPVIVEEAFELVSTLLPGIFSKREVKNNSLFLKREKPATCPVCGRVHQNENAIVSKRRNGDYYFTCLRNPSEPFLLQEDVEVFLPVTSCDKAPEILKSEIELYAEKLVRKYGF